MDIQEIEDFINQLPTPEGRDNEHLIGIEYHGRTSAEGSSSYNRDLSARRVQAVEDKINQDLPDLSAFPITIARGETGTTTETSFRRVDVGVFRPANLVTQVHQNTAAHEAGHMFGLGDEYIDETPPRDVLTKFEGDLPTHYNDVEQIIGHDAAEELIVHNTDSIMSLGSSFRRSHYVYFVDAINRMTGKRWDVE